MELSLDLARRLADLCLAWAAEMKLKPLTVAVLDNAGQVKVLLRQDGTSLMRAEIAQGKARGAIGMGLGSRALYERAQTQPFFIQSVNAIAGGSLVPVPGGVLMRHDGAIIGAIGITGDSSDNDEACAVHAIETLGLTAER